MRVLNSIRGKTTFFVVNQANLDSVPAEKIAALEAELKEIDEENKLLTTEVRSTTASMFRFFFATRRHAEELK